MADTPFRTSPSAIARYFFHDCERFLRYRPPVPERAQEGTAEAEFDHSPLIKAILESGYVWEQTVLQQHLAGRVSSRGRRAVHTRRFDWPQTLELLRRRSGTFIYQPTLRLPQASTSGTGSTRSWS